jgi:hypothetical protein
MLYTTFHVIVTIYVIQNKGHMGHFPNQINELHIHMNHDYCISYIHVYLPLTPDVQGTDVKPPNRWPVLVLMHACICRYQVSIYICNAVSAGFERFVQYITHIFFGMCI